MRVVLRICEALDRRVFEEIIEGCLPDVQFMTGEDEGCTSPWIAEVCFDGATLVSTLTDVESGASSARTWPMPDDAGSHGRERFAAHILADQVRGLLDATAADAWSDPGGGLQDRHEEDDGTVRPGFGLDLYFAVGFDSVGGLTHRTDETSIAIGPGFRLGVVLDDHGIIGLGLRSLSVIGTDAGLDLLDALPLSIEGGLGGAVGPVELQGVVEVIAERWSPAGASWAGGWRAGLGLFGGLVVPIAWLIDFRVDFGVEFFTEGHSMGYPLEPNREIVADLSNLRWRASAGLELRIPLI